MFHHKDIVEKVRVAENHLAHVRAEMDALIIEEYKKCERTMREIAEQYHVSTNYIFKVTKDIDRDHRKVTSNRLSERDTQVLDIVKSNNHGFLRCVDIAHLLGLKLSQVANSVKKLIRLEHITKHNTKISLRDNDNIL